jgi:predicted TIM-barrel fold metal-dependent hydrolase
MTLTRLIDADAHISEPPDVWTSRLPTRYRDAGPQVRLDEQGREIWTMDGQRLCFVGSSAAGAGWSGDHRHAPPTLAECHPACHDAVERLAYMDANAIWAQVLYPNVAGFGAQRFLRAPDETLKIQCVQAYNDFLHEWCAHDPERLIGIGAIPFWDVGAAVREVERCAELGMRGVLFTGEPQRFGEPRMGDAHWDPFYAAAQEAGMPLHLHIGGGEEEVTTLGDQPHAEIYLYLKNGIQCAELIMAGILERFPDLKFVSVESGTGWLPFMLETVDWTASRRKDLVGRMRPSELFSRQVYVTYWFEQVTPRYLLDVVPVDNVLFETDFPHSACLYGNIQETIDRGLRDAPDEVRRKFLWENAARLYSIVEPPGSWCPGPG